MRLWVLCLCSVLGVALLGPATAAAGEIHEIEVTPTGFSPKEITVQSGDIVRWMWNAGDNGNLTIKDGEPLDEKTGELMSFEIGKDTPQVDKTFQETGVIRYFSEGSMGTMTGVITVQEATPVDVTTWGQIKHLFEGS